MYIFMLLYIVLYVSNFVYIIHSYNYCAISNQKPVSNDYNVVANLVEIKNYTYFISQDEENQETVILLDNKTLIANSLFTYFINECDIELIGIYLYHVKCIFIQYDSIIYKYKITKNNVYKSKINKNKKILHPRHLYHSTNYVKLLIIAISFIFVLSILILIIIIVKKIIYAGNTYHIYTKVIYKNKNPFKI